MSEYAWTGFTVMREPRVLIKNALCRFFLLAQILKNDTRKKPKLALFLKNLEIEFSKKSGTRSFWFN